MKSSKLLVIILSLPLLITACTKKADVGDFDSAKWIGDQSGCLNQRAEMIQDLIKIKPNLLALYHKSIIEVLGKPDAEELYERSQTYYWYYIDPSPKCNQPSENPRKLSIRFTAMGIANEIDIK
ncbi:hypothetical protein EV198_0719 [Roseivirga ehrenbergii]|uniref:Lipoprotein n=1 Tax=Roseivirga ehrenbergii (strain DSM 102268 / JCM 13514 / KCTC 12282 / NCIMB 14502 / KMM 6017) TaxID=279360 RepID=A0A150X7T2_ROSEK|nr:hypothetical protein [Roseivirga ehrenbergii]KYG74781.1 hypothetical protein MB14_06140 [Roseivirga ehrenbergii]TCL13887.1 hypothetical protein EV198_0719 [Roseivirga ehrenbergii]